MEAHLHFIGEKLKPIRNKASQINAYYVAIFFKSRVTDDIDERHAFFDDHMEALHFKNSLGECYTNYKYFIASNTFSGDENKGLI